MKTYRTWDSIDASSGNGECWAAEREADTPLEAAEEHVEDNDAAHLTTVYVREEGTAEVLRFNVRYTFTVEQDKGTEA